MSRFLYFIFIIMLMIIGCSPMVFNSNKPAVRKELKQYGKSENLKTIFEETDSTLMLLVRDTSKRPIDIIYHYDKSGKWYSKTIAANCDSCFQKYLTVSLSDEKMEWKKIDSIQYISNYKQKLFLQINIEKQYSFTIRRSNLNRKQYNTLINNL